MPILCNYYLTYRCNAECGFCDIWQQPSPFVALADARQNLADMKRLGVKFIDFTGGEPLMHPEIIEILSMAKRMGFINSVTTNTLLYPKLAQDLVGKIDLLHFSLDSAKKELHDASRGVKCYDKLLHSIDVAKSLGEHPDILFTVSEQNYLELDAVYDNISFKNDLVLLLNPIFQYGTFFKAADSEKMFDHTLKFSKKPLVYMNPSFIQLRRDGGNHIEKPICKAVSEVIVISPSNELILPCYHFGHKKIPIDGKLYEIRKSQMIADEIKLEGRHKFCEGCTVNCYMEPSIATSLNRYMVKSLPSKVKYNYYKLFKHHLLARNIKQRFDNLKTEA
jgi:MoaA/NifB/PqqE/SkfB family radical SAM enzyme